jgi:hypothetical protein
LYAEDYILVPASHALAVQEVLFVLPRNGEQGHLTSTTLPIVPFSAVILFGQSFLRHILFEECSGASVVCIRTFVNVKKVVPR